MASADVESLILGDVKKTLLPRRIEFVEPRTQAGKFAQGHTKFKPINPTLEPSCTDPKPLFSDQLDAHDTDDSSSSEAGPSDLLEFAWKDTGLSASGLRNFGNTCYMNSALQCLIHTVPLANIMLHHSEFSGECTLSSKNSSKFCFLCELQALFRWSLRSKARPVSPKALVHSGLPLLGKTFRNVHKQQDSHEFIHLLFDRLEKDCFHHRSIRSAFAGYNLPPKPADGESQGSKTQKDTSMPFAIYGGYFQSQVKCLACSYESNTYDPYMDLSLEIKGGSVDSALKHHTTAEVLDGSEKYHCPKCKRKQKAAKQLTVWKAPNILMVHLKRFTWHGTKISRPVTFEASLDLHKYMSANRLENRGRHENFYELYGVSCHVGSANGGHYYAFVRSPSGNWMRMDDASTSTVGIQKVLNEVQPAYILFYKKAVPLSPTSVPARNPVAPRPAALTPTVAVAPATPAATAAVVCPVVIEEPKPKSKRKDRSEKAPVVGDEAKAEIGAMFSAAKRPKQIEPSTGLSPNKSAPAKSTPSGPAPANPTAARPTSKKADVLKQLLKTGKERTASVYGARVASWGQQGDATPAIRSQHKAVMSEYAAATARRARDEWDVEYDRGKQPKRKAPDFEEFTANKKKPNRFQSLHEVKRKKQHYDARDKKNKSKSAEQARFMKKVHRQRKR